MRTLKKFALPFSVLLGIGLAVYIPALLALETNNSSSNMEIIITVLLAVLLAVISSVLLIFLYIASVIAFSNLAKRVMIWITLRTLKEAVSGQSQSFPASGITAIEDELGIGLPLGHDDGVTRGHRFVVINSASQEKWGVIEALEIRETSCVCRVFDRINLDFWAGLERRMRRDPSPPQGVTIRREIPDKALLDSIRQLLTAWRG